MVGVILALAVAVFARIVGLDRDRAFYPTVAIVVAALYGLFAVIGASMSALAMECLPMGGFVVLAILGFRRNLWFAAAALFAHGVFDSFHGHVLANPGVPVWWPEFCGSYDVTAAVYLGWLLKSGRITPTAP